MGRFSSERQMESYQPQFKEFVLLQSKAIEPRRHDAKHDANFTTEAAENRRGKSERAKETTS